MKIFNFSTFRKKLARIINDVIDYDETVFVNSKIGNIVVLSQNNYDDILKSLNLYELPYDVKKIKEGEKESIDEMSVYDPNEPW